jgi:hypothetical protein
MSPAHSSPPSRRPALPAFLGGGRPPRHTLVCITSLRGLRRLVLLSLLGQLLTIALLIGHLLFPSPLIAPGRVRPGAHGASQGIGTLALNPAANTAAALASLEATATRPHGVTAPMPLVVVAP